MKSLIWSMLLIPTLLLAKQDSFIHNVQLYDEPGFNLSSNVESDIITTESTIVVEDHTTNGELCNRITGIIIDFVDGTSEEVIKSWATESGFSLSPNSEFSLEQENIWKVNYWTDLVSTNFTAQQENQAYLNYLETKYSDIIEHVEYDYEYHALGDFTPNDPMYKNQWHMRKIGMPQVWDKVTGVKPDGTPVIVAVIDTGVAYEDYKDKLGTYHVVEDLKGVTFYEGYDFVNGDKHANDDHAHGTHVAGTVAQATNNGVGVAGIGRKLAIMPVKVLSGSGSGSTGAIAESIRWVADWKGPKGEKVQVINMSLGGGFPSKIMGDAVMYAHKKGVIVVCAAGNSGRRGVGYPAAYPDAVAVAATRFDDQTTFYSSWGPEVDIAAPGGDTRVDQDGDGMPDGVLQNTIKTQDPTKEGYFMFQGTSMASPHVAGAAGLLFSLSNTQTPDKVLVMLQKSSRTVPNMDKERYGSGVLSVSAAVKMFSEENFSENLATLVFTDSDCVYATLFNVATILSMVFIVGLGLFVSKEYYLNPWTISGAVIGVTGAFGIIPGFTHYLLCNSPEFVNLFFVTPVLPLAISSLLLQIKSGKLVSGFVLGYAALVMSMLVTGFDIHVIPNSLGIVEYIISGMTLYYCLNLDFRIRNLK